MRISLVIRPGPNRGLLVAGALALCLGGCVGSPGDSDGGSITAAVPHTGASSGSATIAFTSIDGLPAGFAQHFTRLAITLAQDRGMIITSPASADYLARGYFSAYLADGGASLAFVWDVFDRQKQREQRVEDSVPLGNSAADPWTLVDDKALAAAASASIQDLADFLATTPEATRPATAPKSAPRPSAAPAVAALDRLAGAPGELTASEGSALAYTAAP